jgi:hypothetical protein
MGFLAVLAIRTESSKIKFAEDFANVSLRAAWSQGAKALLVMWAGREFVCRIDVQV